MEGTLSDYVGVNIERGDDGIIHMTQPQLIQSVLKELNFTNDTKGATTPAFSTTTLKDGQGKPPHNANWSYRRMIGKLNFIAVLVNWNCLVQKIKQRDFLRFQEQIIARQ
jgi:hypothetical protein